MKRYIKSTQGPITDISQIDQSKFDDWQMSQIQKGLEQGLDVSKYADPKFNGAQMSQIRTGLEYGVDVSKYADPNFDWMKMNEIRKGLQKDLDVSKSDLEFMTMQQLLRELKAEGVDVTKHRYELKAERYERYTRGDVYTYRFTAPGDWIAYLSMELHDQMNPEHILEYINDEPRFLREKLPTLEEIKKIAEVNWWGDGSDYIIYLKNLDTGEILYEADYD